MLTSKQRAQLRALANPIETILQVGKSGVGEQLIKQVNDALVARELIKLRVLETSLMTAREACEALCEALDAEPVQCIGTRFVIYKRNAEKPTIVLPK